MIKTVILDDHQLFIDGLLHAFENDAEIQITGFANNGSEGLKTIRQVKPDLVLLDIEFTGSNESGIDILRDIRSINQKIKIMVLTGYKDKSLIELIKQEGANAFQPKNIGINELKKTMILMSQGYDLFHNSDSLQADGNFLWNKPQVTERAMEIIRLLSAGFFVKEIAVKLGIAETTVNDHIERVRRKLGARNNNELVYLATKNKII